MSRTLVRQLFRFFAHLGGFGLLTLGIADSSILFVPLGNDLLFIAMTARNHSMMLYYAVMATIGSVIGTFTVDWMSRKGGKKGLEKVVPGGQRAYIQRRIEKNAGWALALASLMPPPFPFTAFVAAAAGFQYPRRKLLAVIGASRLARFLIEGSIAIVIGRKLLRWARSPAVEHFVLVIMIISIIGSVVSIVGWVKRSKNNTMAVGRPASAES